MPRASENKMNTPNPLVPQGTFPDPRGRSHIRIAVFTILAVHVVLLGALLMAGCKKTTDTVSNEATNTYSNFQLPTNPVTPETTLASPPTNPTPVTAPSTVSTPVVVAPPAPAESEREHVVIKGDSFYVLAKKYGVTVKAISDANPGVESSKLKIGQKLKIPSSSGALASATPPSNGTGPVGGEQTYTVKSGDNLLKIAKTYSVSVKSLRSVNALKTDQIKVGQKLKIPARTVASEPAGSVSSSAPVTATNTTP